jgi:1-acylglycerone phosphate reductase
MGDLGDAGPLVTLLSLDVTSISSLTAVRDRIAAETDNRLDILYHNAGRRSLAMAIDTDSKADHLGVDDEQTFAANLFGVMNANRLFSEMLIAAHGKIVFSGSVSSRVPQPSQAVYNASKAALEMYSRILRIELAPFGIRVVMVMTGGVCSQMSIQRLTVPPGKILSFITVNI